MPGCSPRTAAIGFSCHGSTSPALTYSNAARVSDVPLVSTSGAAQSAFTAVEDVARHIDALTGAHLLRAVTSRAVGASVAAAVEFRDESLHVSSVPAYSLAMLSRNAWIGFFLCACSSGTDVVDAGVDASHDATLDTKSNDVAADVAKDVQTQDAGLDAAIDASDDATTTDAASDADTDAAIDASTDASGDASDASLGDAGLCGVCGLGQACCTIPKAIDYGKCYSTKCLACCM